ncbi:MAG: hypothetical protein ACLT98_16785 [Eggerthellaceae bacterium]
MFQQRSIAHAVDGVGAVEGQPDSPSKRPHLRKGAGVCGFTIEPHRKPRARNPERPTRCGGSQLGRGTTSGREDERGEDDPNSVAGSSMVATRSAP